MERDARRRRITERGSDRLALITGRIQSLDELSPKFSSPRNDFSHTRTQSAPASVPHNSDVFLQDQELHAIHTSHLSGTDYASDLSFKSDFTDGVSGDAFGLRNRLSHLPNIKRNREATQDPVAGSENEVQSPAVYTRVSKASDEAQPLPKACGSNLSCFSLKEINSCIISSENTRVFCSIMIALLVVISYANLPHHIVKSKSLIASRPLYVLLVTDVMIVILRLRLAKQRGSKMAMEEPDSKLHDDGSIWGEAIKVMELGLVLYQTVRGIFIDCSFYTVIVVCGFSLM